MQGVEFLPEVYHQILLLMGREGISRILWGIAGRDLVEREKRQNFEMTLGDCGIKLTRDYFLIMEHAGYQFYFFRTKNKLDDPPVWGQWEDDYFYKLADTLSAFILDELDPDREKHNQRFMERMSTVYYYDPEKDDFYNAPHPDPYDW